MCKVYACAMRRPRVEDSTYKHIAYNYIHDILACNWYDGMCCKLLRAGMSLFQACTCMWRMCACSRVRHTGYASHSVSKYMCEHVFRHIQCSVRGQAKLDMRIRHMMSNICMYVRKLNFTFVRYSTVYMIESSYVSVQLMCLNIYESHVLSIGATFLCRPTSKSCNG
jgi:hypothetical protein